jgi:DNA-binding MarR family transcriptional regulator
MPRTPEPVELARACLELGVEVRRALAVALAPLGITPEQQEVLARIAEGAVTARTLGEAIGRDKTTLSRLLTRLAGAGLVVQQRSQEDRRRQLLELTSRGRELAEQSARLLVHAAPKVMAKLSPKEQRRLAKIARKLSG